MELIDLRTEPPSAKTRTYVHLMRAANQLFDEPELSRLAPSRFGMDKPGSGNPQSAIRNPQSSDPLLVHEQIAHDWLANGGKRSRPFITLAAYDALKGAPGTRSAESLDLPDHVKRTALAIEAFHKASLVHDDIEDDDSYRYGRQTLHRQHGVPTAINVGDYLIGLGYRLVARHRKDLGGDCAADILNRLSEAHIRLSEGQGAELLWRGAADQTLTPIDALKIYALKTAPAFEAALYCGIRLAGPADAHEKMIAEFSKNIGIAFQILNDLKDWRGDEDNKLVAGQDVLAARPTLLLALALEGLPPAERAELLALLRAKTTSQSLGLARIHRLYQKAGVFEKADRLVEKYRSRAEAIADDASPTELRELLYYLTDSVLDRQPPPEPRPEFHSLPLVQLTT
jgi:geranylgeranyl pyrophosphate synthase